MTIEAGLRNKRATRPMINRMIRGLVLLLGVLLGLPRSPVVLVLQRAFVTQQHDSVQRFIDSVVEALARTGPGDGK